MAVGYHGEAERSGDCMLMQKPAAELCRSQIDFDFVPCRTLEASAVEAKELKALREDGCYEVKCSSYEPYLRYYHYEQPDGQCLMENS